MVELIVLCITHFISDLVLQSREMGKKKSEEPMTMFLHFLIIFYAFLFVGLWIFRETILPVEEALALALLIASVHSIQDFLIWSYYKNFTKIRIMNRLKEGFGLANVKSELTTWKYWEDYWFYVLLCLDQLLHYILLIVVYMNIKGA